MLENITLKKKLKIKKSKIILIIILVLLLARIVFINSVTVAHRCAKYVNDYDGFYLYKKEIVITPLLDFGQGGGPGYKVWFLIGQKGKLLKKIKEDVNNILTDMVENYGDIIKGYEISEDFKIIYIYFKGQWPYGLMGDIIETKVELYHELIHGYGRTQNSCTIHFVEVDEPLP